MDYLTAFADDWRRARQQQELQARQIDYLLRQNLLGPDEWLLQAYQKHRGQRCFLVGTGPSLNQIDLSRLENECVMACNGALLIEGLHIDYFISVSHYFFKSHFDRINAFQCERFFLPFYLQELIPTTPTSWLHTVEIDQYRHLNLPGPFRFSTDPSQTVFLGGTVMFPALQLLHYLGFEEVILLGVDHNYGQLDESKDQIVESSDLQAHFTQNYYTQPTKVHIDFPSMNRGYELARQAFEKSGRRILNATPGTRLETYPKVAFEELFAPS